MLVIVPAEKANPIPEFEKNRNLKTDILINSYDNVYEVFKAMPEHADRCWKWWGDLWVRVNFARAGGKVWMIPLRSASGTKFRSISAFPTATARALTAGWSMRRLTRRSVRPC